ncbi:MAG: formate dehydrogenase, partial [Deltaproteobacteria bacterium]|nr:formate dehydrogenase [Deltaproteobacteria bacterium]
MAVTAQHTVRDKNLPGSVQEFLKSVLNLEEISAILVPQHMPMKNAVMPALISDPEKMADADPLTPSFPVNSAKLVSRLTRKKTNEKIAVVLRPCEIRAFIELIKLNQGNADEIIIMGVDCLGAYSNKVYNDMASQDPGMLSEFSKNILSGKEDSNLASACGVCEHLEPTGADIIIGLYGMDTDSAFLVKSMTDAGDAILDTLNLSSSEDPKLRKQILEALISNRTSARDKMFEQTEESINSIEKLSTYLANCVNCYNCRVACPVCYCKECVFVTDVFNHDPVQYLQWSKNKGAIKMPTDTIFFHMTRIAHMSTACIGCG